LVIKQLWQMLTTDGHPHAGDSLQLVWVTNHAELLKEAAAAGLTEPAFVGQVCLDGTIWAVLVSPSTTCRGGVRAQSAGQLTTVRAWSADSHQCHITLAVAQISTALGCHSIQVEKIDCERGQQPQQHTQRATSTVGLQAPQLSLSQDADKSRAVEEEEAAQELQKSLAAKYGPTLEALQV